MGQQSSESGTARREANRRLADEGLSVREISERTGYPKSTVGRDLQGYVPDTRVPDQRKACEQAQELLTEAASLQALQVADRGTRPGAVIDGKQTVIRGPYEKTPERDQRAAQIIDVRRRAARLEYPIAA